MAPGRPPFPLLVQLPFASASDAASVARHESENANCVHYSPSWRKNCDCGDAASGDAFGDDATIRTWSDEEIVGENEGSAILRDVDEEIAIESATWNGADEGSAIANGMSIENGSGNEKGVARNSSETPPTREDPVQATFCSGGAASSAAGTFVLRNATGIGIVVGRSQRPLAVLA
jgi:hypothetical protein